MNFQTLSFRALGLPPVGLGKGHNTSVGEARRKKAQFFFFVFHSWEMSKYLLASPNLIYSAIRLSRQLRKTIRNYPKTIRNYPKAIRNYPKLSGTIQSYPELSKVYGWLRKAIRSYPKPKKAIRNYPKLSGTI